MADVRALNRGVVAHHTYLFSLCSTGAEKKTFEAETPMEYHHDYTKPFILDTRGGQFPTQECMSGPRMLLFMSPAMFTL